MLINVNHLKLMIKLKMILVPHNSTCSASSRFRSFEPPQTDEKFSCDSLKNLIVQAGSVGMNDPELMT
jgi:hypothetical protein